jgi:trk system potassium uptake protein TrkH
MAVPLFLSLDNVQFQDSWLQMVSAFTTTGFSLIDLDTSSDGSALQLWLFMSSWFGGLFFWICAISILLPLNISRFEIGAADLSDGTSIKGYEASNPIINCARQLIPIYILITVGLWLLLTLAGVSGFKALLMAMSVISTSGFEPINHKKIASFVIYWLKSRC